MNARAPFYFLVCVVGLSLIGRSLRAADENAYPVKLFTPDAVGNQEDIHFVTDQRVQTTLGAPNIDPQTQVKVAKEDVTFRIETLEVNADGQATRVRLTIKKATRFDGRDIIKPGAVVEASRTTDASMLKAEDGVFISDEAASVLKGIFPKLGPAGGEDHVYGSKKPRKVGESWPVDKEASAELQEAADIHVAATDLHGQATLKGVEEKGGVKALRLELTMTADNVEMPKNPLAVGSRMSSTMTVLEPVDTSIPPLEIKTVLDMTIQLANPKTHVAGESTVHVVTTMTGTVVPKDAAKTATAAPVRGE